MMGSGHGQARARRGPAAPAGFLPGAISRRPSAWGTAPLPALAALMVHLLGPVALVLALFWKLRYRGGLAWRGSSTALVFNVHPVLAMAGFVVVAGEAALVHRTGGGSRRQLKAVHLGTQLLALGLGWVGIWAAFRAHNESSPPKDNLYSLHSWVGLGVAILLSLHWLGGFFALWYPWAGPEFRAGFLPWHALGGLFVYGLAVLAAETGILEKVTLLQLRGQVKHFDSEPMLANLLGLILALLAGFTVLAAVVPDPRRDRDREKGYSPLQ